MAKEDLVPDLVNTLQSVFIPEIQARVKKLKEDGDKFVHYTSADCCLQILENKQFWMRDPRCMNDRQEIEYGQRSVFKYVFEDQNSDINLAFREIIPSFGGYTEAILKHSPFNAHSEHYVACFSEHSKNENSVGRLSMWRGYGGNNGVAIVLNVEPMVEAKEDLHVEAAPVIYGEMELKRKLSALADRIRDSSQILKSVPTQHLQLIVLNILRNFILSTKNQVFYEEREWRLFYAPELIGTQRKIEPLVVSIKGVPQKVCPIPLKYTSDDPGHGQTLSDLIDRVLIGPTDFAGPIQDAIIHKLRKARVESAEDKVLVAELPLRPS